MFVSVVQQMLNPIIANIRQVVYITCTSEECPHPRGRVITGDPAPFYLLECQNPRAQASVANIINNFFSEGFSNMGMFLHFFYTNILVLEGV